MEKSSQPFGRGTNPQRRHFSVENRKDKAIFGLSVELQ